MKEPTIKAAAIAFRDESTAGWDGAEDKPCSRRDRNWVVRLWIFHAFKAGARWERRRAREALAKLNTSRRR